MKNLKKKIKKVLKLNKKTNKIKNESPSGGTNAETGAGSRRVKSAEHVPKQSKQPTVRLFTDRTFFSLKSKKELHSVSASHFTGQQQVKSKKETSIVEEINDDPEPTEQQAKEKNQLDKRERIDLYKKSLSSKPSACNINEAFDLINNTLIEIEEKYGPKTENRAFYFSKRYGRMFPLTKEKLRFNPEIGKNEMITVGFTIYIEKNGAFEFWSKHPKDPRLIFSKYGATNKIIKLENKPEKIEIPTPAIGETQPA